MNKDRLRSLLAGNVPERMACAAVEFVAYVRASGLDGVELNQLWRRIAPEKSRAWMSDVMTLCRARGDVAMASYSHIHLFCAPELHEQVQASLNVRFAAEVGAFMRPAIEARQESMARAEIARQHLADDERDTWPIFRSLVSASERSLPRNLPVRSVFEWRGGAA
jgi:hypothetical protein